MVVESGIPAGMPPVNIPVTVHDAAVDRYWDGCVVISRGVVMCLCLCVSMKGKLACTGGRIPTARAFRMTCHMRRN